MDDESLQQDIFGNYYELSELNKKAPKQKKISSGHKKVIQMKAKEKEIIGKLPAELQTEIAEIQRNEKTLANDKIFYGSRFAAISLPARTPKGRTWERTNGRDSLYIHAGRWKNPKTGKWEDLKIPAGIEPRRILLYLSHAWQVKKANKDTVDRKIYLGSSLFEFLKFLDSGDERASVGGEEYKRISEQINRLFHATIGFMTESEFERRNGNPLTRRTVEEAKVSDGHEIWFEKEAYQTTMLPSYIRVTEAFARWLEASLPLKMSTVKLIGGYPLAFDLYAWLNLRHYNLGHRITISWQEIHEQLGANYKILRQFKPELKKAFEFVKEVYPHNSKLTDHGIQLNPSKVDVEWKKIGEGKIRALTSKKKEKDE